MDQKSFFIGKDIIKQTLATAPTTGKKSLEPLKTLAKENKLPITILEDQGASNEAEVHLDEGDLWYCLEGEVTFVYGGELENPRVHISSKDNKPNPRELRSDKIKNGTEKILTPGDWLWIPAGEPHQHFTQGLARLAIIKIPSRT